MRRFHNILPLLVVLLLSVVCSNAAFADAVGTWHIYPSYNDVELVEVADKTIFVKASGNLYSYNTEEGTVQTYDKTNCLSDVNITNVTWNSSARRLVIVYENQNIDLLSANGSVINVPDLYQKQMTGDKTVNSIYNNGKYSYLATNFGIVKMDDTNGNIVDSYILNKQIVYIVIVGNYIYGLTRLNGVIRANMKDNLNDPASWSTFTPVFFEYLFLLNGKLIGMTNGNANIVDTNTAEITNIGLFKFTWAKQCSDRILCGQGKEFHEIRSDFTCHAYSANHNINAVGYDKSDNTYWSNSEENRLTKYTIDEQSRLMALTTGVLPDGPSGSTFWRLKVKDGKLYTTSGKWTYEGYNNAEGIVNTFLDGAWGNLDLPSEDKVGYKCMDVNTVEFDPADANHLFLATRSGLYEYRDDRFVQAYNINNSLLTNPSSTSNDPIWCIITELKFDNDGNLWVFNPQTDVPLKCLTKSGEWKTYPHSEMTAANKYGRDIQRPCISSVDGNMWFTNTSWSNSAVYAYDCKTDVLRNCRDLFNQDGTKLSTDGFMLFGCTEDRKGNMWLASTAGPLYVKKENIQAGQFIFEQHKVPRNDGTNYADYLLNGIRTNCIFIDSANRKWIGTATSGVFVISDDCNKQIANFTSENSILPSNDIFDITIDGESGKVYIATAKGLCSYMSDSTEGSDDMDKVYAYPNPVTPDYTGDITVVGLEAGAQVIITTVSGQKVAEGSSTGGSFVWDGCDLNGSRVASGVYMICVAKPDGKSGVVSKVAVVR